MNKKREEFTKFLQEKEKFSRNHPVGHITGSCWIINRALTKVLLTHHRKLNIWIPTGGHSEGESDPLEIALREGEEETGLKLIPFSKDPFYTDIHDIPEYRGTPKHKHFDYTYIFHPLGNEDFTISTESHDLKWIDLDRVEDYSREENVILMRDMTLNLIKCGNLTILE